MDPYTFKIDNALRDNLYSLCRLCGMDHPEKELILEKRMGGSDGEPDMGQKVFDCVGIRVTAHDKMPQRICILCVDKINDIHEYREMCSATNKQTRKLLGLPDQKIKPQTSKNNAMKDEESILGDTGEDDEDDKDNIALDKQIKAANRRRSSTSKPKKKPSKAKRKVNDDDIKHESDSAEVLPVSKRMRKSMEKTTSTPSRSTPPSRSAPPMVAVPARSHKKKAQPNLTAKDMKEFSIPLLTLKTPNQRERQRENEVQKKNKVKRSLPTTAETLPQPLKQPKIEIQPPTIPCSICDMKLTKAEQSKHMTAKHLVVVFPFACSGCLEGFTTFDEQKDHHLWHRLSKTSYTCRFCDDTFERQQMFTRHLTLCKPELEDDEPTSPDIPCTRCKATFATRNLYDWHDCFIVANGKCIHCGRRFLKKHTLFIHTVKCEGTLHKVKLQQEKDKKNASATSSVETADIKIEPGVVVTDKRKKDNDIAGESHCADANDESSSDSETEVETPKAPPPAIIKQEPIGHSGRVEYDDSDDDVIFIENSDDEVPIVVVEHSTEQPKQLEDKERSASKRVETPKQSPLIGIVKQEPVDEEPSSTSNDMNCGESESETTIIARERNAKTRNKIPSKSQLKSVQPNPLNPPSSIKQEPNDDEDEGPSLPLNVSVKSEPLDAELLQRIKTEKDTIEESLLPVQHSPLRLMISKKHGTHNSKIISSADQTSTTSDSPAKPPSKPAKNLNKAALLMAKIRQEMLDRQAREKAANANVSAPSNDIANVRVKEERMSPSREMEANQVYSTNNQNISVKQEPSASFHTPRRRDYIDSPPVLSPETNGIPESNPAMVESNIDAPPILSPETNASDELLIPSGVSSHNERPIAVSAPHIDVPPILAQETNTSFESSHTTDSLNTAKETPIDGIDINDMVKEADSTTVDESNVQDQDSEVSSEASEAESETANISEVDNTIRETGDHDDSSSDIDNILNTIDDLLSDDEPEGIESEETNQVHAEKADISNPLDHLVNSESNEDTCDDEVLSSHITTPAIITETINPECLRPKSPIAKLHLDNAPQKVVSPEQSDCNGAHLVDEPTLEKQEDELDSTNVTWSMPHETDQKHTESNYHSATISDIRQASFIDVASKSPLQSKSTCLDISSPQNRPSNERNASPEIGYTEPNLPTSIKGSEIEHENVSKSVNNRNELIVNGDDFQENEPTSVEARSSLINQEDGIRLLELTNPVENFCSEDSCMELENQKSVNVIHGKEEEKKDNTTSEDIIQAQSSSRRNETTESNDTEVLPENTTNEFEEQPSSALTEQIAETQDIQNTPSEEEDDICDQPIPGESTQQSTEINEQDIEDPDSATDDETNIQTSDEQITKSSEGIEEEQIHAINDTERHDGLSVEDTLPQTSSELNDQQIEEDGIEFAKEDDAVLPNAPATSVSRNETNDVSSFELNEFLIEEQEEASDSNNTVDVVQQFAGPVSDRNHDDLLPSTEFDHRSLDNEPVTLDTVEPMPNEVPKTLTYVDSLAEVSIASEDPMDDLENITEATEKCPYSPKTTVEDLERIAEVLPESIEHDNQSQTYPLEEQSFDPDAYSLSNNCAELSHDIENASTNSTRPEINVNTVSGYLQNTETHQPIHDFNDLDSCPQESFPTDADDCKTMPNDKVISNNCLNDANNTDNEIYNETLTNDQLTISPQEQCSVPCLEPTLDVLDVHDSVDSIRPSSAPPQTPSLEPDCIPPELPSQEQQIPNASHSSSILNEFANTISDPPHEHISQKQDALPPPPTTTPISDDLDFDECPDGIINSEVIDLEMERQLLEEPTDKAC